MVGFALILIILAIVFMVFLSLSQKKSDNQTIESYEATSFLSSLLEYTSPCSVYYLQDFASIQELIGLCSKNKECYNGDSSCEVLNEILSEVLKNSWHIGNDYPQKGYSLLVSNNQGILLNFTEGNITRNFKGAHQELAEEDIYFDIYT